MAVTHCTTCGHPMRPSTKTLVQMPGTRRHVGRGLCRRCHDDAGTQDELIDHTPINRTWDDLAEELEVMLQRTTDPNVIASTLSMKPKAIARSAHRHGRTDLARIFWAYDRQQWRTKRRAS